MKVYFQAFSNYDRLDIVDFNNASLKSEPAPVYVYPPYPYPYPYPMPIDTMGQLEANVTPSNASMTAGNASIINNPIILNVTNMTNTTNATIPQPSRNNT